ncbi:MAG TPA: FIVAR domain-containing protein, partial [Candidatus Mediterraneibacter colneyensis]|nr:FIVAR domain-containing protein [Candidatus Mediterraneibacter colneyensis]
SDMEVDFEITVTEAGEGVITLTADDANAPSIDKFVITPKTFDGPFWINVRTTDGGTAQVDSAEVAKGGSTVLTITPEAGYEVSQVKVGGSEVKDQVEGGKYTISNVNQDTDVDVIFTFANYTEENRFEFPTAKDEKKTLEAEHFTLHPTEGGYLLQIEDNLEGASNGKYVDGMDHNDVIEVPYYAEKAGAYEVTLTYASGSTTNEIAWATTPEDLIKEGGSDGDDVVPTVGAVNEENKWRTVTFNITVTKPGPGVWTFTGPEGNSPRLDKFDIKLTSITAEAADKVALEIAIQDGNREAAKTDAFTLESIQALEEKVAEAQKVFEDKNATQEQADNAVSAVNEAIDNLKTLTYTINASAAENGGGTVTASEQTVDRGESVDLTIVPDYGYEAVSIQVNNEVINSDPGTAQNPETEFYGPNGTYTISNITEDQTVVVTFEETGYTEKERFTFPKAGNTAELDAAKATLFNSGGNGEKWKLDVSTGAWTTGEGFINSMNSGDKICIPYTAAETGEYTVTVVYRSGNNSNGFSWSEAEGKIENGSVTAGANDSAGATHEKEFTMNVETAGDGILTIAAGASGAPQIDKLVISKAGTQPDPEEKYTVTASVKDNVGGTVSVDPTEVIAGNSATVTFTPAEGYKVGTVTVNDTATEVTGNSLTLSDIREDKEVIVTYELDYYTENNRFYLPTEVGVESKTVQAEHFILKGSGDPAAQEIREVEGTWAEGGIFVNWFNNGDSIVLNYFAQKAGTYEFVMRYQSGSATNGISWSGANITLGSLTLDGEGEADDSSNMSPKTKTFEVEITKEGEGQLIISAGAGNAPQVDQFEISLTKETSAATVNKDALKQAIDAATAKLKDETFTQESRDELAEAIKTAQGVFEAEDATQEQVNEKTNLLNNFPLVKAPVTYTVTADEVANGSITLTGDAEDGIVEEGQDAAYTVTANSGYVIDTLTVNGAEVAEAKGLETYSGTVEDVNADVTIAATFKLKDSGTNTNLKDLYDAIEDARAILKQTDKYTAASLEEYGKIIDAAYAVYESDNADADDIAAAIQSLKDGLSVLVEQGGGTTDPGTPGTGDDKPGTGSGGDSSGNGKPQGGSGSGKDTVKAAQTGDDTNVMIWIIALAAAAAAGGAVLVIRKRSTR